MPAVEPVASRRDLREFIDLPYRLHRADPIWVPPLRMEQKSLLDRAHHPFWKHAEGEYFLARREGRVVGRIAAIVDRRHNEFHEDRVGFWGFFECEDDVDAARPLFEAAESWLRERGRDASRGPVNPSMNETCGLLIEGFDRPPAVQMAHNPEYYARLVTWCGYAKAMDLLQLLVHRKWVDFTRLNRIAEIVRKRVTVTIRSLELARFDEEIAIVKDLYNRCWERNWGFVPLTDEEFDHAAKQFRPIVVPSLAHVAEMDGRPVGFCLGVPDVNRILKGLNGRLLPFGWLKILRGIRKLDACRVIILGVLPELQKSGLGALLYLNIIEEGPRGGTPEAEMGWVLETNTPMLKPLLEFGGRVIHRYRIYQKPL